MVEVIRAGIYLRRRKSNLQEGIDWVYGRKEEDV